MPRDPRAFTQPWRLVEVTSVTIQNRYLLRPSAELNDLVIGVVGRAQRKYEMPIMCITVLSSHYHILLFAQDANHMASFMDFVNTNISKEVGTLHDWPGTLFPNRYKHIEVSDDPDDQIARLKYCLSNGVKEFLVDRCRRLAGSAECRSVGLRQAADRSLVQSIARVSGAAATERERCRRGRVRHRRAYRALAVAVLGAPAGA